MPFHGFGSVFQKFQAVLSRDPWPHLGCKAPPDHQTADPSRGRSSQEVPTKPQSYKNRLRSWRTWSVHWHSIHCFNSFLSWILEAKACLVLVEWFCSPLIIFISRGMQLVFTISWHTSCSPKLIWYVYIYIYSIFLYIYNHIYTIHIFTQIYIYIYVQFRTSQAFYSHKSPAFQGVLYRLWGLLGAQTEILHDTIQLM